MRILFLSHYFPPEGNAPATRVHNFAKRWVAAGHQVTVITCAPNVPTGVVYEGYRNRLCQREVVDGIDVIRVWTYLARNAGMSRRSLNYGSFLAAGFCAALSRARPDVLIATSPQMLCGVAGGLVKTFKPCPFVLEVRDLWPESITTVGAARKSFLIRALERLEKWMYAQADRIVTVGPGYRLRLIERGVPRERITVISNAVDLARFQAHETNGELRARYGLHGKVVFAYVGTVGMAAGLEVVLAASRKLRESVPAAHFLIVGDGAERPSLEAQAKQLGLDNVTFTGLLPKDQMPQVLAAVDVAFVHLKKADLFQTVLPSKIFEAAAMRLPILLGVQGDAEEIVVECEAGLTMRPGDPDSLVRAVTRLAQSEPLRRELGANGATRLAPRFDADRLAAEYLHVLRQLPAV